MSIVLAGKVVDEAAIRAVLEEITVRDNIIIKVMEEIVEERTNEETAKKMIAKGYDSLEIIELTGLSIGRLSELRSTMTGKPTPA